MSCYSPNGTLIDDSSFAPCNSIGGNPSMCCAINKPDADICLSNGVCRWVTNGQIQYFRNSCSDENWDSPFCLNQCTGSDQTLGGLANNARLSLCPDGSWCCGDDVENSCCSSGATFSLAATIGVTSSSSSTVSSATSTSSSRIASSVASSTTIPSLTSASPSTTSSPTSAPPSGGGLSTGAQAGIGVGVALGALIAIGLIGTLLWRRRKRLQAQPAHPENDTRHELDAPPQRVSEIGPSLTKPEVYAKVAPPERPRAELA